MKKEILIGFIIAVFATVSGFFLYIELFLNFNFEESLIILQEEDLFEKVLGLAAIPNLFVFFVFLKKNKDNRAKGVLLATILIALTMLILKFV